MKNVMCKKHNDKEKVFSNHAFERVTLDKHD